MLSLIAGTLTSTSGFVVQTKLDDVLKVGRSSGLSSFIYRADFGFHFGNRPPRASYKPIV